MVFTFHVKPLIQHCSVPLIVAKLYHRGGCISVLDKMIPLHKNLKERSLEGKGDISVAWTM